MAHALGQPQLLGDPRGAGSSGGIKAGWMARRQRIRTGGRGPGRTKGGSIAQPSCLNAARRAGRTLQLLDIWRSIRQTLTRHP